MTPKKHHINGAIAPSLKMVRNTRWRQHDPRTPHRAPNVGADMWAKLRNEIETLFKAGKTQKEILAELKLSERVPQTTTANQLGPKLREWGLVRSGKIKHQHRTAGLQSHPILDSNGRKSRRPSPTRQSEKSFKHETGISSASFNSGLSIWTLADGDPYLEGYLNHRYFQRGHPSEIYRPGVVFAVLKRVKAPDRQHRVRKGPSICSSVHLAPDQRRSYSICLCVVAKNGPTYSVCAPICTYGGMGLAKPGLSAKDIKAHAVICISGAEYDYLPGEPQSSKRTLVVESKSELKQLSSASRVDFRKPLRIPHSEKVMEIGQLDVLSLQYFRGYFEGHTLQG